MNLMERRKGANKDQCTEFSTLLDKGSGRQNEDCLLAGVRNFGVFDGATSLQPQPAEARISGGARAAEISRQAFSDETLSLEDAAKRANESIRQQSVETGVNLRCKEQLWSCSAAVIRLHGEYFDWCQIGDCQIMVIGEDGRARMLTDNPGQDVGTLRLWQQKARRGATTVMEAMAGEIAAVRRRMNVDYGVFNGEPEAMEFLATGSEPLAGIAHIVLFSDGLFLPQKEPAASPDLDLFTSLYLSGGLGKVREYVRTKQLEDIGCRHYPRFKVHDDISAVALRLTAEEVTTEYADASQYTSEYVPGHL